MHYANGATTTCQDVLPEQFDTCSDLNTTAFLKRVITEENPDLLVFSGNAANSSQVPRIVESFRQA